LSEAGRGGFPESLKERAEVLASGQAVGHITHKRQTGLGGGSVWSRRRRRSQLHVLGPPAVPTPGNVIDYIGRLDPTTALGYCYDDVPF